MATTIEFDFRDLSDLKRRMESAGDVLKITLNEGLREIGRIIVPAKGSGPLARNTPQVTGKLARSTVFQITGGPRDQRLEVRQGARTAAGDFYGGFVRDGTKPHVIEPVNAKALRFMIAGQVVFAKRVNHPGNKSNPYHIRTLEQLRGDISRVIKKMGVKVTAHMGGN